MDNNHSFGCLLVGGPEHIITVSGADYRFEMHGYCGPMPIHKNGSERPLPPRHWFWAAVDCWLKQGRKISEDGKCSWLAPYGPLRVEGSYYQARDARGEIYHLEHMGGKHFRVLTHDPRQEPPDNVTKLEDWKPSP